MTITGSNTTHFNFQKIGSNDDAGWSTIGEVIDSIDTLLNASDRLIAAGQSPTTGYTIEWNGSDWVAGQLDTAGIADSAVTSAKIADGTIVNADINASAAIDKTKISGTAVTIADTGTVTSTMLLDGTILNADVNAAAAIDKTKISGTAITAGDTGTVTSTIIANDTILNADINSAAAISYSKLNLASSIVNADISSSAAIEDSKLATISTAGKVANTATTATNANTASAIVARDSSGNFSAGTITAALIGNASTATSATSATTATTATSATSATTATNLAGGAGGSIPYQSAADTTAMLSNGSAGQILTSNGTTLAPSWQSISSGSLTLAGDVAGAANANTIGVGAVTSSKIANDTIVNEDINSAAAIAYSKLSLGNSIVNADISSSAAIVDTKLATISTASKVSNSATTATDANTASAIVARDASGNFTAGTITLTNVNATGYLKTTAPVTKTADFTVAATENWLISNKASSCTVTLPTAASFTGREITIKNLAAFTIVSASADVKPIGTNTAGTAILPATAGTWCTLVSDGSHWIIMQSGPGLFS